MSVRACWAHLRDGQMTLDPQLTTVLLEMVDAVRSLLSQIEATGAEGDADYSLLVGRMQDVLDGKTPKPAPAAEPDETSAIAPAAETAVAPVSEARDRTRRHGARRRRRGGARDRARGPVCGPRR